MNNYNLFKNMVICITSNFFYKIIITGIHRLREHSLGPLDRRSLGYSRFNLLWGLSGISQKEIQIYFDIIGHAASETSFYFFQCLILPALQLVYSSEVGAGGKLVLVIHDMTDVMWGLPKLK